MRHRFRFVELGDVPEGLTFNVMTSLRSIQSAYDFDFDGTRLEIPATCQRPDGTWDADLLERHIEQHKAQRRFPEHPVAVTSAHLAGDFFCSSDRTVTLFSIYNWDSFCSRKPVEGLVYLMAGALLDFHVDTPAHEEETLGCPNDYCDDLTDINVGMNAGSFCSKCTGAMLRGIQAGRLNVNEAAAIQRLLDNVARRRVLAVIMPFRAQLSSVYLCIRRAAERSGFECTRADEARKPGVAMHLVSMMIDRAELIIADLTGQSANVLYELGQAHAWGKNTILIGQEPPEAPQVPFDLRHWQYIQYRPDEEGLAALEEELVKYLG